MDPNNPGMLPPGTSSGYAALHHPAEVTKVKKAKKHKKHHRDELYKNRSSRKTDSQ